MHCIGHTINIVVVSSLYFCFLKKFKANVKLYVCNGQTNVIALNVVTRMYTRFTLTPKYERIDYSKYYQNSTFFQ